VIRRYVLLLPVLVLMIACSGTAEQPEAPEETAAEPTVYTVRGMFARVEDDGLTMTVRHEEIPGYMPSMSMPFTVKDAALLEGLEYGDKIEFELEVGDEGALVQAINVLPEGTVLAFE